MIRQKVTGLQLQLQELDSTNSVFEVSLHPVSVKMIYLRKIVYTFIFLLF